MLEDNVKGKARRWAELMFEASFILPADRANKGLLIISLVAAGYEAAQPRWISVEERLPEEGEFTLILVPVRRKEDGQIGLEFFRDGRWQGWVHDFTTHWLPIPPAPEEEK